VSKPIFKKGLIGVSDNKLKDIKLNGNFVQSLELVSKNGDRIIYQFYPTNDALKIAYSLGEVSKIVGISNVKFKNTTFHSFNNAKVERIVNYQQLVTLFYNTSDKSLSSKTLREALSYTIPNDFSYGLRNFGPYVPFSFATQEGVGTHKQDLTHAKELLDKVKSESGSDKKITLTIEALPQYKGTAEEIAEIWKKLDIDASINIVNKIPSRFQVFLGEFNVPQDLDQYALWHSDQPSNITHYSNLRVDKLLEDGRRTIGIEKRKSIYADFQKYILSDPPASFLFFPYTYDVTRK
jgi:peptide/nickel transport system substrate-binding protein